MTTVLEAIPEFVINGLGIATGLLPAFGFALLLQMMVNKNNVMYFVLGFALAVYLGVPLTGIAIFTTISALIITQFSSKNTPVAENVGQINNNGGINYEDEEF